MALKRLIYTTPTGLKRLGVVFDSTKIMPLTGLPS